MTMADSAEISRSLLWANRLVFFLGLLAIGCVSAFSLSRELLQSMGAFDQGPGAVLFQALTHEAVRYIAIFVILAVIAKEWWFYRDLRFRFKINVVALIFGISFFGLFFLFHYLYVHVPSLLV